MQTDSQFARADISHPKGRESQACSRNWAAGPRALPALDQEPDQQRPGELFPAPRPLQAPPLCAPPAPRNPMGRGAFGGVRLGGQGGPVTCLEAGGGWLTCRGHPSPGERSGPVRGWTSSQPSRRFPTKTEPRLWTSKDRQRGEYHPGPQSPRPPPLGRPLPAPARSVPAAPSA